MAISQSQKRMTASASLFFQFNHCVWKFEKDTDSSKDANPAQIRCKSGANLVQIRRKFGTNPAPTEAKEDGTESELKDKKNSSWSVKSGTLENVLDREMKSIHHIREDWLVFFGWLLGGHLCPGGAKGGWMVLEGRFVRVAGPSPINDHPTNTWTTPLHYSCVDQTTFPFSAMLKFKANNKLSSSPNDRPSSGSSGRQGHWWIIQYPAMVICSNNLLEWIFLILSSGKTEQNGSCNYSK